MSWWHELSIHKMLLLPHNKFWGIWFGWQQFETYLLHVIHVRHELIRVIRALVDEYSFLLCGISWLNSFLDEAVYQICFISFWVFFPEFHFFLPIFFLLCLPKGFNSKICMFVSNLPSWSMVNEVNDYVAA